jgi:hypothetical protein
VPSKRSLLARAKSWVCLPALQSLQQRPLGPTASPPRSILSWNRLLVQSSSPDRYRGHRFRDPTSPLAVSRALWFSQTERRRTRFKNPPLTLFEFRLPPESFLALPSRPLRRSDEPATLLGFDSLQHIRGSGVHLPRVCLARYVPPSGFDYPPDGLLPPDPRRPCFVPAALLGFSPPKRSPPERYPRRFRLG